jgi:LysM repeat protein
MKFLSLGDTTGIGKHDKPPGSDPMRELEKLIKGSAEGMTRRQFVAGMSTLLAFSFLSPYSLDANTLKVHKVRKGETLTRISKRYGVSVRALQEANGIRGSLIYAGQNLKIPSSSGILGEVQGVTENMTVNRPKWKYIVAHHSATTQGSAKSFDRVDRKHGMKNGLAYHFVIGNGQGTPDGEIEIGSRWTRQLHGGHVSKWEFNNHGIGICLVGNFEKTRPTQKQLESLNELVGYLGEDVLKSRYKFYVHKEINPTLCPGRYFPTTTMHKRFS